MADISGMVASAVVVPEAIEETLSPTPTGAMKRRQSSVSEGDNKRARMSERDPAEDVNHAVEEQTSGSPPLQQTSHNTSRKARLEGRDTEKQRGKRLFGALLGTLSQSSSSTAQKRRAEIEKKQRDKLRNQAEEDDEKKRRVLEDLMAIRRVEQKKYDAQSMRIRHSNSLAMAGFLRTTASPTLYYKPWELLPQEKDKIQVQIQEAEAEINAELENYEQQTSQLHTDDVNAPPRLTNGTQLDGTNDMEIVPEATTVGSDEAMAEVSTTLNEPETNPVTTNTSEIENTVTEQAKESVEDNEDAIIVEAGEDPVIY